MSDAGRSLSQNLVNIVDSEIGAEGAQGALG